MADYKGKRKKDLVKHNNLNWFALLSILFFGLIIYSFNTKPKIFTSNIRLGSIINSISSNKDTELLNNKLISLNQMTPEKDFKDIYKFQNLNIIGKSFVVYDVNTKKVIYAKNENEILPLASLTKVVTAITASNLAKKDTAITIHSDYMEPDEYLDIGLKEGQVWKMEELLKYGLTISSNSSMDIIAKTVSSSKESFLRAMNGYVQNLGFNNFTFTTASGLDYGEQIGGKGSAYEYARLFAKSYELIPDIMSYTINSKVDVNSDTQKILQIPNTNKGASQTVGLLASKTGFTDAAGGNLAIMFNVDMNRPVVIVVLGSTQEDRFQDVKKLYDTTLETFY